MTMTFPEFLTWIRKLFKSLRDSGYMLYIRVAVSTEDVNSIPVLEDNYV